MSDLSVAAGGAAVLRPTRVRHVVLWLTVLAYMITYMDRVVISVTGPMIQAEYGLSNRTWGWVLASSRSAMRSSRSPAAGSAIASGRAGC